MRRYGSYIYNNVDIIEKILLTKRPDRDIIKIKDMFVQFTIVSNEKGTFIWNIFYINLSRKTSISDSDIGSIWQIKNKNIRKLLSSSDREAVILGLNLLVCKEKCKNEIYKNKNKIIKKYN